MWKDCCEGLGCSRTGASALGEECGVNGHLDNGEMRQLMGTALDSEVWRRDREEWVSFSVLLETDALRV